MWEYLSLYYINSYEQFSFISETLHHPTCLQPTSSYIFFFFLILFCTSFLLSFFFHLLHTNKLNMLVNQEMYEDNNSQICSINIASLHSNDDFSLTNQSQIYNPSFPTEEIHGISAMEMELQNQLNIEMDHCYNPNISTHQIMQDPNWEYYNQEQSNGNHYPQTPDLLNLFNLPRTTNLIPNQFSNPTHDPSSSSTIIYDPLLHLNLPPQPPMFRELFQGLGHGYGAGNGSGLDETESGYPGGDLTQFENDGVMEFGREVGNRGRKDAKHFTTERQRRVYLNDKYQALKLLVPISTKPDRASIVGDAIGYIQELKRTVAEMKILVEKKRCSRDRIKRQKLEDGSIIDDQMDSMSMKVHGDDHQSFVNGGSSSSMLRSSWLQRKSKNTEVDVRIIDDEATIKLVQQKRVNCLLIVSKTLDELQLDLHHVAGGLIGDFYSFFFNTKISEGSSVYASAIANKLIDAMDRHYAAIPTANATNTYN